MKRLVGSVLVLLMCVGLIVGCGKSYDSDTSTVYILDKGKVVSTDVEDFDENVYNKTDLENYVNNEVSQYKDANGKEAVKLDKLTVENGKAMLTLQYATVSDYTKFSGMELFTGSIAEAQAAGYHFDQEFATVEDGKAIGNVNASAFLNNENLKVVVIKGNVNVNVDGTILYATTQNVSVVNNNTVSIRFGQTMLDGKEQVEEETESLVEETESTEAPEEEDVAVGEEESEIVFDFGADTPETESSDEFSNIYAYIIYK